MIDDSQREKRVHRAKTATVSFVDVGIVDPWSFLSDIKKEFMKAIGKMHGNEEKKALMLEFLELAKVITEERFKSQSEYNIERAGR